VRSRAICRVWVRVNDEKAADYRRGRDIQSSSVLRLKPSVDEIDRAVDPRTNQPQLAIGNEAMNEPDIATEVSPVSL